jgi:hypothetical protein
VANRGFASLEFDIVFTLLAIVITCRLSQLRRESWAQNGRKTPAISAQTEADR